MLDSDDEDKQILQKEQEKKQRIESLLSNIQQDESELIDQVERSGFKVFKNKGETANGGIKHNPAHHYGRTRSSAPQNEKPEDSKENKDEKDDEEDKEELTKDKMTGQDALFSLMAIRMMKLA